MADEALRIRANTLLTNVSRLLGEQRDKVSPENAPERLRHEGDILALYGRVSSLFEAAAILARRGYPEEALMLSRALYTESLWLEELESSSPKRRIALMTWWHLNSINDMEHVQHDIERRDSTKVDPDLHHELERRRRGLQDYASRHGVRGGTKFPSEEDLAKKHGRLDNFGDFLFSHQFVHGGFAAHAWRYKQFKRGDDSFMILTTTTADPSALAGAAAFVSRSALLGHQAAGRILGWSTAKVQPLLDEAERVGQAAEARRDQ